MENLNKQRSNQKGPKGLQSLKTDLAKRDFQKLGAIGMRKRTRKRRRQKDTTRSNYLKKELAKRNSQKLLMSERKSLARNKTSTSEWSFNFHCKKVEINQLRIGKGNNKTKVVTYKDNRHLAMVIRKRKLQISRKKIRMYEWDLWN
ncbi:UNVERIFIED_CONTAM: hypothetical protein K2H54_054375 [Gekko kuhli]